MKHEGLGDTVDVITYYTGIKHLVIFITGLLGISCGCETRRKYLNKIFPYKRK